MVVTTILNELNLKGGTERERLETVAKEGMGTKEKEEERRGKTDRDRGREIKKQTIEDRMI